MSKLEELISSLTDQELFDIKSIIREGMEAKKYWEEILADIQVKVNWKFADTFYDYLIKRIKQKKD